MSATFIATATKTEESIITTNAIWWPTKSAAVQSTASAATTAAVATAAGTVT